MTTGKTVALTKRTFVDKVTSLLFNMLFRFVLAFRLWIFVFFSWQSPALQVDSLPAKPLGKPTWKESYDKPRQSIKKQRHHFADKGPYSQSYGFSSSHVWMWELDSKKSWVLKNWCVWIVMLDKTLDSPLNSKEIKPVSPKGNQPWIFIGKTDAEAKAPIL